MTPTKSCPCKKRNTTSLLIKCSSNNCSFGWWHANCAGFSKDATKTQLENLGWTCPCCVIDALQITGYVHEKHSQSDLMLNMRESLNDLKSEINDLRDIKQSLADVGKHHEEEKKLWSDVVKNAGMPNTIHPETSKFASNIANKVVQKSNEIMHERDVREKNVIIFNVVESVQTTKEEKVKDDQNFFNNLCDQIHLQSLPTSKIVRIGREKTSSQNRENDMPEQPQNPRPIKVSFNTVFDKKKVFGQSVLAKRC